MSLVERPADLDGYINDPDRFFHQSTGRGVLIGDHRQVRVATGLDLQQITEELLGAVFASMAMKKALDEGQPPPELPRLEQEAEKKAALVWVMLRRRYTWLTLDDIDLMEATRVNQIVWQILDDLVTLQQETDIPDTVADDTPLEAPQPETHTGPPTLPVPPAVTGS